MSAARLTVDAARISVARSIAAMAEASATTGGPLVVVTHHTYAALTAELGSPEAPARRLFRIATSVGRPIAVNVPTDQGSQTVCISPKNWSQDRLAGWIAGHHEALERQFGTATVLREQDL